MTTHDMIVIGGGTAGLVTAAGSAAMGARVALIERERLGGECLWSGCVPSKALLACAKAAAHARAAGRFGVDAQVRIDYAAAMRWVHAARARIAPHDSPERFRALGVEVVEGTARFVAERTLDVEGRRMTAKRIVIATGSRPAIPEIPGLETVPFLTNETIFERTEAPSHLLVVGAGPIGLELAQGFTRLGAKVTLLDQGAHLLPREEPELARALQAVLEAEGVTFHLETRVSAARRTETGVSLVFEQRGVSRTIDGSDLLVAAGRRPNLDTLDLPRGNIAFTERGVVVDRHLRTTAAGIWAAGDCLDAPHFTHVADYQARLVVRNAFFPFKGSTDYQTIPWVTYSDPELAHVGLTEQEARARHGDRVQVWTRDFHDVDRAITDGETQGTVKLVALRSGRLLGGHILGAGAGDMIGELSLALRRGLGLGSLATLIHPYPSMPEAIRQAAEQHTKARFTAVPRAIARWFARR